MLPFAVAIAVLVLTVIASLVGFRLQTLAIFANQDDASRAAVRGALGLVSMVTAIVLGMVTASAKDTFDAANESVAGMAVDHITLDKILDSYGPETTAVRDSLKKMLAYRIDRIQGVEAYDVADLAAVTGMPAVEVLYRMVNELEPATDFQKDLQFRALDMIGGRVGFGEGNLAQKRWYFTVRPASVPQIFVVVVMLWLVLEFLCYGIYSPRTGMVVFSILVASIVVASAMFLLLEMEDPIDGYFRVSVEPLERAIELLDR
ncbi:MAG: hypothetical protein FJ257_02180 [Phycisphaerae bacterium]|nr:hypothetical protein [Phycisphaerae bacterium]